MKKIFNIRPMASISLSFLGACATMWEKPGATVAEFEQDKGYCISEGYSRIPANMVQASYGNTTQNTNCYRYGYHVNCQTTQNNPTPITYDANGAARNAAIEGCLYGRGWSKSQR